MDPSLKKCLNLKHGGVISLVGAGGKTTLMFGIAKVLSDAGDLVLTTTTTKMMRPDPDQSRHLILSDSLEEILERARELVGHPARLSDRGKGRDTGKGTGTGTDTGGIFAASGYADARGKLTGLPPEFIDELWKSGIFRWILVEADGAARRPLKAPAPHEPLIPKSSGWVVGVAGLDAVGKPLGERWVFRHELYAEITGLSPGQSVTEASMAAAFIHENGIMKQTRSCPANPCRIAFLNKADCPGTLESGRKIASLLDRRGKRLERVLIGKALCDPVVVECFL